MKTYLLILLFLCQFIRAQNPTEEPLSAKSLLETYQEMALAHNPKLRAEFELFYAEMQKKDYEGVLPDPKLMFSYFIQPVQTAQGPMVATIGVNQSFPWFGLLRAKKEKATHEIDARQSYLEQQKALLLLEVKNSYYDLSYTNKELEVLSDNLQLLENLKTFVQINHKVSRRSAADIYFVKMEINELEYFIEKVKDHLVVLKVEFIKKIKGPKGFEVVVEDLANIITNTDLDKASLHQQIFDKNTSLKQIDHTISALSSLVEVSQKAAYPSFSIGASYTFIGEKEGVADSGTDAFVPSVGLNIPIFQSKYRAKVLESEHKKQAKILNKQTKIDQLETKFEQIWADYQNALRSISLHKAQRALAEKTLQLLKQGYATGTNTFQEIILMEQRLLHHTLKLYESYRNQEKIKAMLEYLKS